MKQQQCNNYYACNNVALNDYYSQYYNSCRFLRLHTTFYTTSIIMSNKRRHNEKKKSQNFRDNNADERRENEVSYSNKSILMRLDDVYRHRRTRRGSRGGGQMPPKFRASLFFGQADPEKLILICFFWQADPQNSGKIYIFPKI
jgi:hypothetical protein